jgi:hypothetical protein
MGDRLSVIASASSSTRVFGADVNEHSFVFVSHGPHQMEYVELHAYAIPHPDSCSGFRSPFPDTERVLHLKGFGASVSVDR